MISIFTNNTKMLLKTHAEPQVVLQMFRARIIEDDMPVFDRSEFYKFIGKYVGKVERSELNVRSISIVPNFLEPTMRIQQKRAAEGGTSIRTHYTTPLSWRLFLIAWMLRHGFV